MKQLTLTKPWSYHSIEKTIDFNEAGTFEVTDEVHAAAVAAGVAQEEKADGDGDGKAGTPRRTAAAEK